MKRKKLELMFRRAFAGGMSVAMLLGMTACQNTKSQEEPAKSSTESGTPEISEDQGASDEGAADETAGAGNYLITEENENEEVVMNDQPESSYWFPEQLLVESGRGQRSGLQREYGTSGRACGPRKTPDS